MSRALFCIVAAATLLSLGQPALADTITVDSLLDDSLANLAANGTCDLREAIEAANTDAPVDACPMGNGVDDIDLAGLAGTITVDPVAGELFVAESVNFNGPGPGVLTLSGGNMVRIFNIETFSALDPPLVVSFHDLMLADGSDATRPGLWGGAIRHHDFTPGTGTLTLDNCVFTNNNVLTGASSNGGAINSNANTIITDSLFTGNHASDQAGALQLQFGAVTITGSTFTGNTAGGNYGGAIFLSGLTLPASLRIESSTISGNSVGVIGGGVAVQDADVTIVNSTVSGNSATSGGGVSFLSFGASSSTMRISHSTIADNTITGGLGAGLVTFGFGTGTATVELETSIMADSTGGVDCFSGPMSTIDASAGFNVDDVDDADASCISIAGPGNQNVDPGLDVLAANGGATETHALLPGSPAIDGGGACAQSFDQRGRPRPIGTACDSGSFEGGTVDLGDAPDPTLPTLLASGGAYHTISPLFLGAAVDDEIDGQPDATATGDDIGGSDDEDGVVFTSGLVAGGLATVEVTASAAGLLDAWIDFDQNGAWAGSEQVFASQALAAGLNSLSFTVPGGASAGGTFARFRLSTAGGLSPGGGAADGEVEDYAVTIAGPISVAIGDVTLVEGDGGGTTSFDFPVSVDSTAIAVTVTVDSADGTATSPADYGAVVAQVVSFPQGGPLVQTVSVPVVAEGAAEGNETFIVALSNPSGGATIAQATGTGTILNDDGMIDFGGDLSQAEGSGGGTTAFDIDVTLSDVVAQTVTVDVATLDGSATAGADYVPLSQTLTFLPGDPLSQTVTVDVVADDVVEGDEDFMVSLTNLSGIVSGALRATLRTPQGQKAVILGDGDATVTILEDDAGNASMLEATKEATGTPRPHGTLGYTIVITNPGPGSQPDNPGDEMVDVLPPELELTGATADVGTVTVDLATNTVTWNGSLAAGASATVEIDATILIAAGPITNQAEVFFDTDNDGVHDSSALSSDPVSGGPTTVVVPSVVEVPTLSHLGLVLLALTLAWAGWRRMAAR
ncbi:MAG: IPTL-CTERM sorting domain-containing protein [Acidobacteriota bacterium]